MLGILLAIYTWAPGPALPQVGLDASWQLGIEVATERGLDFGQQIIWTHGPLGFLQVPILANGELWMLAEEYTAMLHIALCISLVWVARRSLIGLVVLPVAVVAILAGLVEVAVVLAAIWGAAALAEKPPPVARILVLYIGPVFAAVEILGKANRGAAVLGILAVCVLAMENRRRNAAIFAGIFVAAFAFFWAITGQSFGTILDYFSNQLQIVSGFGESQPIEELSVHWQKPVALLAIGATLLLAARAEVGEGGRARRWGTVAIMAIFAFTTFKQGFVRHDVPHGMVFFTTFACGLYALVWRVRQDAIAAGTAALIATAALACLPANAIDLGPATHLSSLKNQAHAFVSSSYRNAEVERARSLLVGYYDVDPESLQLIGNRRVHIDPWENAVAWAYRLNWDPLPVFQDQQAYTEQLQDKNLTALESSDGPERILRANNAIIDPLFPTGAIDGDLGSFDPPRASIAMLCNFEAIHTTERWQVLARIGNRCGPERPVETIETRFGEPVQVPEAPPNQLLVAHIHGAEVGGFEKLRSFLYKPYARVIVVDGVFHGLNPGTAASGLLLRAPADRDYPAPFELAPQASEIAIGSYSGTSAPLTIEFDSIPISLAGETAAP